MKLDHEYVPADHACTCPCHGGAQIFEYLPCCQYEGMLRAPNPEAERAPLSPQLLAYLKKMWPQKLAEELCSVQPMPSDLMEKAMAGAKDEKWLRETGYEPVSHHGLMWIKKEPQQKVLKESCTCYRCNIPMVKGSAIDPKYEEGERLRWDPPTLNAESTEMIEVWKCPTCGHSEQLYDLV